MRLFLRDTGRIRQIVDGRSGIIANWKAVFIAGAFIIGADEGQRVETGYLVGSELPEKKSAAPGTAADDTKKLEFFLCNGHCRIPP